MFKMGNFVIHFKDRYLSDFDIDVLYFKFDDVSKAFRYKSEEDATRELNHLRVIFNHPTLQKANVIEV